MQDTSTQAPIPPPPHYNGRPRRKTRWWIPVVIVVGVLVMFIGVLASVVAFMSQGFSSDQEQVNVSENTVLMLDLSGSVPEHSAGGGFPFGNNDKGSTLLETLSAIDRAQADSNIKGIYYRAGGGSTGMAKLAEIRDALVRFRKSGKFIYTFIEAGTKQQYYIGSVADSVFMPEEGMMEFTAFGASGMFMKGLYDKLGITWHVEQFEEYKSAAESMSRTSWSEPAKAELRPIIEQRRDMFVAAVAASRNIPAASVLAALDRGLFTPDSLKAAGLIDGFRRESELRTSIHYRLNPKDTTKNPKLKLLTVKQYVNSKGYDESSVDKDHGIAVVYASGAIMPGKGSGPFGNEGIYAKSLIADLRKARDNKNVDAILLRIDSPGGSAMASDEIWAEIRDIRKTKPVFASMSDVAASGGYYIAMACDTIVAHPATVTGSIGVIMSIPNLNGTAGKLGITTDTVSTGRSSAFMNVFMPANDADKAILHNLGSGIYTRFVQKVADSRKKSFEETRTLARGRVWTGTAAKDAGLVDVNGGLLAAIEMVKKHIGVPEGKKAQLYIYPEEVDAVEAILKMFGIGNDDDEESSSREDRITMESLLHTAGVANDPLTKAMAKLPVEAQMQLRHSATMLDLSLTERTLVMLPTLPL